MNEFMRIAPMAASKLRLGLHADLHMRLHSHVKVLVPPLMLLTQEDVDAWGELIEQESDIARETAASALTATMIEKDAVRKKHLTSLFSEVRAAVKSVVPARAVAGKKLKIIIDAYKGINKETIAERTAHVIGLLVDLEKPENASAVQNLGLDETVDGLKDANAAFSNVRQERVKERAAKVRPDGKTLRAKLDKTANQIFRHIEAAYLTATDEGDAKTTLMELINKLNRIIAETKTTHNESLAQRKLGETTATGESEPAAPLPGEEGYEPAPAMG